MKYAACTMCKNEEHNVEKWLKRTKDFDYRVVVDTGSTDKTVELFHNADVEVPTKIFNSFKFDEARNYVMSKVPEDTDWLFWPDMDEEYESGWREEMEKTLAETPDATRVLHTSIHHINDEYESSEESGTVMDSKIHKYGYYSWVKPIHEHLEPIGEELIVSNENIIRQHYHFDRPEVDHLCYEIALQAAKDYPDDDWNIWFALKYSYDRKIIEDILKYGRMYLDNTKPYTNFRSMAHTYIAEAIANREGEMTYESSLSILRAVAEDPDNKRARALYTYVDLLVRK